MKQEVQCQTEKYKGKLKSQTTLITAKELTQSLTESAMRNVGQKELECEDRLENGKAKIWREVAMDWMFLCMSEHFLNELFVIQNCSNRL